MKRRVFFKSQNIRNLFFKKVLSSYNFLKWNDIVLGLNIPRVMLSKYRTGFITIPEPVYKKFIKNFNEKDTNYFCSHINYIHENWGKINGGKSTYLKHKQIFDNGRRIANDRKRQSVTRFDINLPLTKELSYFIGLFIGDGFTNKYGHHYLLQFTGDKRKERGFYTDTISKITLNLFKLSPVIKEEVKTNALRVNFYSLNLYRLIIDRFKIKEGRKSREVLIPEEIFRADSVILLSCIAGIYDAEGCFYFDERTSYKYPYPVIVLHMNNPPLIRQISTVFIKEKIRHSFTSNYSTLYVYGKESVQDFLNKIKLLNPKYAEKIKLLGII
ncbi:hypothetical protein A3K73_08805 [Candidatus Pacearchaeota archaeon RBG_13_36_9]|nr:MAG: hypothetical protein A3K73_08805 [Candidatus Pacearchaeota archaeon RBG_13_36_9]